MAKCKIIILIHLDNIYGMNIKKQNQLLLLIVIIYIYIKVKISD